MVTFNITEQVLTDCVLFFLVDLFFSNNEHLTGNRVVSEKETNIHATTKLQFSIF